MSIVLNGFPKAKSQLLPRISIFYYFCTLLALAMPLNLSADKVGSSRLGLKGGDHVGILSDDTRTVSAGAYSGFGVVESMGPIDGAHPSFHGGLSAALELSPAFAMALGSTGFVQFHPDDQFGKDKSLLGMPFLRIRTGTSVTSKLKLGGEIVVMVPGTNAPSLAWSGTTLDFSMLLTFVPASGHTISATAGFRLDNSENAAPDMLNMRYGDRISLQYSSAHAILTGFLWLFRIQSVSIWTELTADILLSEAIALSTSPLRLGAGVRYWVSDQIQVYTTTSTSLSSRPDISLTAPLVPIEPRFLMLLGATWKFDFMNIKMNTEQLDSGINELADSPAAAPTETTDASQVQAKTGTISSRIRDASGLPVAGAEVTVVSGDFETSVITNRNGEFEVTDVPVGNADISVQMPFFDTARATTEVTADDRKSIEIPPLMESEVGSQIRGLIRNLKGNVIVAEISVMPGNREMTTDNLGEFQLDVEPGQYVVIVKAPGYRKQRRNVTVEKNSVEILNVELRKK